MKSCHVDISHWVSRKCCSTWATFSWDVSETFEISGDPDIQLFQASGLARLLKIAAGIFTEPYLPMRYGNMASCLRQPQISSSDSPSKWIGVIGGWHWFQILEHVWLEYMHWNCLDPSYLILHGKYVQRVAADRSVARQAFGLRDVGRSGAMIQDGFQKTKNQNFCQSIL